MMFPSSGVELEGTYSTGSVRKIWPQSLEDGKWKLVQFPKHCVSKTLNDGSSPKTQPYKLKYITRTLKKRTLWTYLTSPLCTYSRIRISNIFVYEPFSTYTFSNHSSTYEYTYLHIQLKHLCQHSFMITANIPNVPILLWSHRWNSLHAFTKSKHPSVQIFLSMYHSYSDTYLLYSAHAQPILISEYPTYTDKHLPQPQSIHRTFSPTDKPPYVYTQPIPIVTYLLMSTSNLIQQAHVNLYIYPSCSLYTYPNTYALYSPIHLTSYVHNLSP